VFNLSGSLAVANEVNKLMLDKSIKSVKFESLLAHLPALKHVIVAIPFVDVKN
jgi:hypothetical protein